jgi:hypothetical protein
LTRAERLKEFYNRLKAAPAAIDPVDALLQIQRIMYEVEDELSGLPRQYPPPCPMDPSDGRMYPPVGDEPYTITLPDGTRRIRTAGHRIVLYPDGTIEIWNARTSLLEMRKPGALR